MIVRFLGCLMAASLGVAGTAAAQGVAGHSVTTVTAASGEAGVSTTAAAAPFRPDSVFVNPDVRPQFTGGAVALQSYMAKTMHYPAQAMRQHVTGRVFVRFVLSATGRVTDASLVKGPGNGLNEEALRLVWLMPPWQPARQSGQAVRVVCTMPIEFQL